MTLVPKLLRTATHLIVQPTGADPSCVLLENGDPEVVTPGKN